MRTQSKGWSDLHKGTHGRRQSVGVRHWFSLELSQDCRSHPLSADGVDHLPCLPFLFTHCVGDPESPAYGPVAWGWPHLCSFQNWEHGESPVGCAWAALSLGASAHLVHRPPQASCLAPLTVDLVTRPACWVAPVLPSSTLFSVLSVVCPLSFPQFQRLAILSIQDQVNKTTFADSFLF